ncbi:MAG TPA: hypothetical protein VMW95_07625 [Desulfobacterales bacterium]|nr:hypothetical protein [Desulfobacterales bacterium]
MSTNALNTYNSQLETILGSSGQFTEEAIYDPSGVDEAIIYGVFDDHTFRGDKDGGNVRPKLDGPRFITADTLTFDIYDNKELQVKGVQYKIQYIDKDEQGFFTIWLH